MTISQNAFFYKILIKLGDDAFSQLQHSTTDVVATKCTSVKLCSTSASHDHCSKIVVDVGSNPTTTVVFVRLRVIRPRGRSNYLFS